MIAALFYISLVLCCLGLIVILDMAENRATQIISASIAIFMIFVIWGNGYISTRDMDVVGVIIKQHQSGEIECAMNDIYKRGELVKQELECWRVKE